MQTPLPPTHPLCQIFGALVDWWFAASNFEESLAWLKEPLVSASLSV